jgi:hypothetical protein
MVMNNIFKILILISIISIGLSGCGVSEITRGANSTYIVSAQYGSVNGSFARATKDALERGNTYCESKGKKFIFLNEVKEGVVGFTPQSSTITFRCDDENIASENIEKPKKIKNEITSDVNGLKIDGIKKKQETDAVAIIIGIQNYKKIPKSSYSNDDARVFAEYANKILGVKQQNIKVLIDDEADNAEIYRAFQNWLPLKVKKNKTDIFVFYSGHGLPSDDGNSLYFLPHGADRDFISKTAINQSEIIAALQASQPNSVTMFIDSCYSGLTRTGDALLASARPIAIKSKNVEYPTNFTVISASSPEQISWSSVELKHGIFSYYLMKGMEGDADENKDGKITVGEMQAYLTDMVPRQALVMNRKQVPQLTGDANRVLLGR